MSSLRNHRIVIASLFLPNTAVLGEESEPSTPGLHARTPSFVVEPVTPDSEDDSDIPSMPLNGNGNANTTLQHQELSTPNG